MNAFGLIYHNLRGLGCFEKLLRMKSLIIPASLMILPAKCGNKKRELQKRMRNSSMVMEELSASEAEPQGKL